MRRRLAYFWMAGRHGWSRVRHPLDNLGLAVTLLAAFGLPTTLGFAQEAGLPGLAAGVFLGIVALVLEGAFELWFVADQDDRQAVRLRMACEAWRGEVEHFMEVREAARPPVPDHAARQRSNLARRLYGAPEISAEDERGAKQAAEAHDRETVSLYIERFAKLGLELFTALVDHEALAGKDGDRDCVRSPQSPGQVDRAIHLIRLGEWDDLRWGAR